LFEFDEVTPTSEEITLILHISNFDHQNGGLWFAPVIGKEDYLRMNKNRWMAIDLLVLGCILILALYHLYLFILRPIQRYGLYFFFIALALLFQSLVKDEMPIFNLWPDIPWAILIKMDYASFFVIAGLNTLFLKSLFPQRINPQFVKALSLASLVGLLTVIFLRTEISYYLVYPFQIITIITGYYLIYELIRATIDGEKGTLIILIGLVTVFLTVINDILLANYLIASTVFSHFGTLVYVISLSIVLANFFVDSVKAEEKLKEQLESTNLELEQRVIKRTKQLEEQKELVARQNKTLSRVNEELKQLMAVVAHDLKSPLSRIYGLSQLMNKELTGKMATFNDHITQFAKEGADFIDSLIEARSFEVKGVNAIYKTFNLQKLLLKKIEQFRESAEQKQIEIKGQMENIEIRSDKELVSRILDNLLSNAIKFSPAGKEINLRVYHDDDTVAICVKDEGPGFSEEDKQNAFKKFQKLSAKPTGGESSSGLGLSIVKSLTEELEGTIDLHSQKDHGAEFIVRLPYQPTVKQKKS
jgi:signal transduction histidine kinase